MDIKDFQGWLDKGLYQIGHYFTSRCPFSLAYCISKLDLSQSERFRFNQINHFLHSIWKDKPETPKFSSYELWCGQAMEQKGGISVVYASLSQPPGKSPYMIAWEEDFQFQWSPETWQSALSTAFKGIINFSLVEANIKVLSRFQYDTR